MNRIKILIADDTLIAREGCKKILETVDDFEILGEALTAQGIPVLVRDLRPDVLILDLKWFGDKMAGLETIKRINNEAPLTKIIAITAYRHLISDARRAGAVAALPKGFSRSELVDLIKAVHYFQENHESVKNSTGVQIDLPTIFVSYSHKDKHEIELLLSHLGVLGGAGLVEIWSDDRIGAGVDWETEIKNSILKAKIAILLISANYLNSKFILDKEVPELLKRRDKKGLIVIPVIAKACAWKTVDWLVKMNVRPKNGTPIWSDSGSHVDKDLAAIVEEVADIIG